MTPGMGDGVEGGPPRAAMATAMGARGELGSGRGRERHGLGEVDEVMEMLTSKGIAPRWTGGGDRSEACCWGRNREAGNWSNEEDERWSCAARRAWWWRGELVEAYL